MQRTSQRELGAGPRPIRLRVGALLCVLLATIAGIAQAAHIHGDWLPNSAVQIAAHTTLLPGTSEDACPLCTAMHSALPVASFSAPVVGLLLDVNLLLASTRKPERLWYFAAFSRPPPSA